MMDKKQHYIARYERQQEIHKKGFNFGNSVVDYSKSRIGNGNSAKKVDDASVNLKTIISEVNSTYTDKTIIVQAINNKDLDTLRDISDFYFDVSGIYKRACEYLAFLYRYDYYLVTHTPHNKKFNQKKVLENFYKVLGVLDNSHLKSTFNRISLEIIKRGVYYGYKVDSDDQIILQDLPANYCRSRFYVNDIPAVEFNMKYFDDTFRDSAYRDRILKIFPKEFAVGYELYKKGLLPPDNAGEASSWYLLSPEKTVKFCINNSEIPYFVEAIPAIIDLEEAKEVDRKKMLQQLMKILIQKLPIDKNGDLVFDVSEAKDLHANAVAMLQGVLGTNVLTTFADISVEDMDTSTVATTTSDSLQKVERGVFDQMGLAKNLFNTDGNTALEKSIIDDEASVRCLVWQYEAFLNDCLKVYKDKNAEFRVKVLETTIYNHRELSKLYKEQVQLGYSKLLPQLALGHSQSEILAELKFENEILNLSEIMVPAQMSSTMSGKQEGKTGNDINSKKQNDIGEEKAPGRKELPDDEKSDKTLANREAIG